MLKGREDLPTLSKLELFMRENGLEALEMDTVFSYGLMELNTKVTGEIIELMERVNSPILMETFMTVTG
jgi:hypothetical protein